MSVSTQISRFAFASTFAAALCAPGAALACNPIQFLFGGCHPTPPRVETALPSEFGPKIEKKRRPKIARAHNVSGAKQTAIAPPAGAQVGSIAHFVEDQTLRRGDVVVTPNGFLVYRGRDKKHSADDFAPLDRASGDLAALEKASHAPTPDFTPVSTPKSATNASSTLKSAPPAADRDFSASVAN